MMSRQPDASERIRTAERIQGRVATGVIGVGIVLAVTSAGWYMLALGPGLASLAKRHGAARSDSWGYWDPFLVGFGSFVILLLPLIAFGNRISVQSGIAPILIAFGVLLFWALGASPAWRPHRRSSLRSTTLLGLGTGLGFCVLASVILLVRAPVAFGADGSRAFFLAIFAMYLGGGATTGLAVGALQRLSHWPLGRMLMGVVGATIIYTAAGGILMVLDPAEYPPGILMIGPVLGALIGPIMGIGWEKI